MAPVVESIAALTQEFTLANAWVALKPLLLFLLGVVVYAVFIFKFYRFVARKDVFELDLSKYHKGLKFLKFVAHVFKYIFLFPLLVFFWFVVLSLFLIFLTKGKAVPDVLLTAMGLVGSIRVVAYYSEDLSKDLAKMLPFALLGIFLLDVSYFSFSDSLAMVGEIPGMWQTLVYYLVFVIALEFVLRVLHSLFSPFASRKEAS